MLHELSSRPVAGGRGQVAGPSGPTGLGGPRGRASASASSASAATGAVPTVPTDRAGVSGPVSSVSSVESGWSAAASLDDAARYAAVCGRDARFDGEFLVCVHTTGIYCRPSCPARTPHRENVSFQPTAAAAQRAGFRACRRCRPDAVPGSAAWDARADLVARAMRLIGDGTVDRDGVAGLAARLGYSERQLRRALLAELGAGPIALARAQRAHTARVLLTTTDLPAAAVAFAAGFASVRQFNDTIRAVYAATPGRLRAEGPGGRGPRARGRAPRRARPATAARSSTWSSVPSSLPPSATPAGRATSAGPVDHRPAGHPDGQPGGQPAGRGTGDRAGTGPSTGLELALRLPYRGPYAYAQVFDYLAARALPGIEEVLGEPATPGPGGHPARRAHGGPAGGRRYRRTLRLPHGPAVAEVAEPPASIEPVELVEPGEPVELVGPAEARAGADLAEPVETAGRPVPTRAASGAARRSCRGWLDVRLWLSDPRDLTAATARLRRLFDLDADPVAVADRLGPDPLLGPLVARTPGLRAPGAVDPRELALRAVLGQQVSVVAARRLGAALVAGYGTPLPTVDGGLTHLFPTAERLATADLGDLGMPASRRATLRAMAAALTGGEVSLDGGADRAETQRALLGLPGVGPWTAGYIRMRGLGDPDVALPGDAAVRATLARIGAPGADPDPAAGWRPWRTYATHHLWRLAATADRR